MKIIKAEKLKEKPADQSKLGFGKIFTDYMMTMKYKDGKWQEPQISRTGPFLSTLQPRFSLCAGYFRRAKAFRNEKGEIRVFRPRKTSSA